MQLVTHPCMCARRVPPHHTHTHTHTHTHRVSYTTQVTGKRNGVVMKYQPCDHSFSLLPHGSCFQLFVPINQYKTPSITRYVSFMSAFFLFIFPHMPWYKLITFSYMWMHAASSLTAIFVGCLLPEQPPRWAGGGGTRLRGTHVSFGIVNHENGVTIISIFSLDWLYW